jgi:hypothetical protein
MGLLLADSNRCKSSAVPHQTSTHSYHVALTRLKGAWRPSRCHLRHGAAFLEASGDQKRYVHEDCVSIQFDKHTMQDLSFTSDADPKIFFLAGIAARAAARGAIRGGARGRPAPRPAPRTAPRPAPRPAGPPQAVRQIVNQAQNLPSGQQEERRQ